MNQPFYEKVYASGKNTALNVRGVFFSSAPDEQIHLMHWPVLIYTHARCLALCPTDAVTVGI